MDGQPDGFWEFISLLTAISVILFAFALAALPTVRECKHVVVLDKCPYTYGTSHRLLVDWGGDHLKVGCSPQFWLDVAVGDHVLVVKEANMLGAVLPPRVDED